MVQVLAVTSEHLHPSALLLHEALREDQRSGKAEGGERVGGIVGTP